MTTPLVSILVPTLKRPQMLRNTLLSLAAQDYAPLEIFVSDNGSHDETTEVLEEFAHDPRFRMRANEGTAEIVTHWNQLLFCARGKYCCLLSDDDEVSTNFVSTQVAAMEAGGVAFTMTTCETIDEHGNTLQRVRPPRWTRCRGVDFMLDWLWGRTSSFTGTFLSIFMRTEQARAMGGFPPYMLGLNADNGLMLALALQGDVVFCKEALFRYRIHSQSFGLRSRLDVLAESSRQMRFALRQPPICDVLQQLPHEQAREVFEGVAHMLARQYFFRAQAALRAPPLGETSDAWSRVVRDSLGRKSAANLVDALRHYDYDWPSLQAFAHYATKTLGKKKR